MRLIAKIIRQGKFRQTGPDFTRLRDETLQNLPGLYPSIRRPEPARMQMPHHSALHFWMGQLAFLRSAFRVQAGHLRVPAPDLCYIRIPRSASTAVAEAMLSLKYPHLRALDLSPFEINVLADANLETRLDSSLAESKVFAVVRNPFIRIVSFYRSFFEESDTFIYEDYLFGIFRKEMSFRDFVTTAALIPDGLKDQHLKPQRHFLRPYAHAKLKVQVLRLEDTETLHAFCRLHGLPLRPFNVAKQFYDYREYYDLDTLHMVNQMYAEDIQLWGYSQQYEALKNRLRRSQHRGK